MHSVHTTKTTLCVQPWPCLTCTALWSLVMSPSCSICFSTSSTAACNKGGRAGSGHGRGSAAVLFEQAVAGAALLPHYDVQADFSQVDWCSISQLFEPQGHLTMCLRVEQLGDTVSCLWLRVPAAELTESQQAETYTASRKGTPANL